jgi:hypothetical protein
VNLAGCFAGKPYELGEADRLFTEMGAPIPGGEGCEELAAAEVIAFWFRGRSSDPQADMNRRVRS